MPPSISYVPLSFPLGPQAPHDGVFDRRLAPGTDGVDQFRRAVNPRGLVELYYGPMADLIAAEKPDSVHDYGCGDGRLAEMLADRGMQVTGFDPNPAMVSRSLDREGLAAYMHAGLLQELLAGNVRFDAVVCGRVLCTIADDSEFKDVLSDLRRLISDSGTVLVSVCNPFHLSTESTELCQRLLPYEFSYEDTFTYQPVSEVRARNDNRNNLGLTARILLTDSSIT